jgi:hypothetical protein
VSIARWVAPNGLGSPGPAGWPVRASRSSAACAAAVSPGGICLPCARVRRGVLRGSSHGPILWPDSCHTCTSSRPRTFCVLQQDSTRARYRVREITIGRTVPYPHVPAPDVSGPRLPRPWERLLIPDQKARRQRTGRSYTPRELAPAQAAPLTPRPWKPMPRMSAGRQPPAPKAGAVNLRGLTVHRPR